MPRMFHLLVLLVLLATAPSTRAELPQPPESAFRALVLVDLTARQTLGTRNADAPFDPAGLTALMTVYLTLDAVRAGRLRLDDESPLSPAAAGAAPPRLLVPAGTGVTPDQLLRGVMVLQARDAAVSLAERVGGTVPRFVGLMNDQARILGLGDTVFGHPAGLATPGQRSTPGDLARLAQRLLDDFPQVTAYSALRSFRHPAAPSANDANRTLLTLRDPAVDGLLSLEGPGGEWVGVATARRSYPHLGPEPSQATRRLVLVAVGTGSEALWASEAQKLLNWGFSAFEPIRLFDARQPVVSPSVWKGTEPTVALGAERPLVAAVPAGQGHRLRTEVVRPDPVVAPLQRGQVLGQLRIHLGDTLLAEQPLQVLEAVPQAGWLGRAWDALRLWIQ